MAVGPAVAFPPMTDETGAEGVRQRLTRSGEDALGKLAQDLLENPLVSSALARAFGAREKAAQAQEVAMGALNIPSAADIERLTRRVRSVSQRLEGIEDGVDRLDERLAALQGASGIDDRLAAIDARLAAIEPKLPPRGLDRRVKAVQDAVAGLAGAHGDVERLEAIESRLVSLVKEVEALRRDLPGTPEPVPVSQERLVVTDPA
jgi:hypothetical protein